MLYHEVVEQDEQVLFMQVLLVPLEALATPAVQMPLVVFVLLLTWLMARTALLTVHRP